MAAQRQAAKQALRNALTHCGGDPQQDAIAAALEDLVRLNPTPDPAQRFDLAQGNWRLISAPSFPDGERQEDGTYVYRLGRLAFNLFQPQDLRVQIDEVWQPVFPLGDRSRHSHDIVVTFTTLGTAGPPLQGQVRNLGVCEPQDETHIQVQFTGGVLEPIAQTDRQQWQQVFGDRTDTPRSSWKERGQGLFLRLMFGFVPPGAMDPQTGKREFQMKRSPKGTLEILYLDEELRITRGEKGTVLVCERV
ncbi:PAP/fibrillin family protein [Lyngbya confervoides]|uniref:PAP/fibrillin family protein n=1 Tax=Lyngbya confervoides BDU141951 TaxID=1574623 RepID=A0ABD4SZS5_9CYAN|nr:PAP/fibrillin family protein [Lyngbya confervoides]MCM1981656.1 PAP/fibrillin family protein [Lyngbya confervoides BDU141951]